MPTYDGAQVFDTNHPPNQVLTDGRLIVSGAPASLRVFYDRGDLRTALDPNQRYTITAVGSQTYHSVRIDRVDHLGAGFDEVVTFT